MISSGDDKNIIQCGRVLKPKILSHVNWQIFFICMHKLLWTDIWVRCDERIVTSTQTLLHYCTEVHSIWGKAHLSFNSQLECLIIQLESLFNACIALPCNVLFAMLQVYLIVRHTSSMNTWVRLILKYKPLRLSLWISKCDHLIASTPAFVLHKSLRNQLQFLNAVFSGGYLPSRGVHRAKERLLSTPECARAKITISNSNRERHCSCT